METRAREGVGSDCRELKSRREIQAHLNFLQTKSKSDITAGITKTLYCCGSHYGTEEHLTTNIL